MAVNRAEELSTVQQNAQKNEFYRLLDEFPELDQIYREKRLKKIPFEWRDIVLARVTNPKIPLDQVWDAYTKGFLQPVSRDAQAASPGEKDESRKRHKADHDFDDEDTESDLDLGDEKRVRSTHEDAHVKDVGEEKQDTKPDDFVEQRDSEISSQRASKDGGVHKKNSAERIAEMNIDTRGKDTSVDAEKDGGVQGASKSDDDAARLRDERFGEKEIERLKQLKRRYPRQGSASVQPPSVSLSQPAGDIASSPVPLIRRPPQREDRSDGGLNLARRARALRTAGRGGRGAFSFLRGFFRPGLKNVLQAAGRLIAVVPGGKIAIIIVAIFLLLAFFIINQSSSRIGDEEVNPAVPAVPPGTGGQGDDEDGGASPIPGLDLGKTGPVSGDVGDVVEYTITAEYSGSLDVLVYDPIAPNAEYVSSDPVGVYDDDQQIISWRLLDQTPAFVDGDLRTYTFQLSLRPVLDNITLTNQAFASASLPTGAVLPPNLDASTFEELMEGQGRNVTIFGNEDEFIEAIFANAARRFEAGGGRGVYEPYLRELYRISVANNVNPVIVLTIWGVEQSHRFVDGYEFGCLDAGLQGFANQVRCSVETLNKWMGDFEEKAAIHGLPVTATIYETCAYRDAFVYAYEWYTPVCTMNHGNDDARRNFIIYYKEFLQGPS